MERERGEGRGTARKRKGEERGGKGRGWLPVAPPYATDCIPAARLPATTPAAENPSRIIRR